MIINFKIFESKNIGLKRISKQEAIDRKLFGPVYHGTRASNWEDILINGFKIFYESPSNTYLDRTYDLGYPPPLHHLGYGIYFTNRKTIAKKFNFGTEKNLKPFYLDIHNICEFSFRSKKKMMEWWLNNGYDGELGKKDRFKATKKLTNFLKTKYDAVWFKDSGMYGTSLDGDQIVVFDPKNIYMLDETLSGKKEIGSKVTLLKDIMRKEFEIDTNTGEHKFEYVINIPKGMKGEIIKKVSNDKYKNDLDQWSFGSDYVYTVKWKKGGTTYNILDNQIE